MGHDISGYNKQGEEIAYARYAIGNGNSEKLYNVLDAWEYYGGVSGLGQSAKYNVRQIEQAIEKFKAINWDNIEDWEYEKNKLERFLNNCLETAKREGEVSIYFG